MGGSQSLSEGDCAYMHKLYTKFAKAQNINMENVPKIGGANKKGHYFDLKSYAYSVYPEAKEKLIRAIAKSVASGSGLNKTASQIENMSINQVVQTLAERIPKGSKIDGPNQVKACKLFAKAINKNYGYKVIDESASPSKICQDISEVMYSLFTGLQTEFMAIYSDVQNLVKNLNTVKSIADKACERIKQVAMKDAEEPDKIVLENLDEVRELLDTEYQKQLTILQNIVSNTIEPGKKSLVKLLEDADEFKGLVSQFRGVEPGTDDFGRKLGLLLTGTIDVARAAEIVKKKLDEIGLPFSEYKASKNLSELEGKLYDQLVKKRKAGKDLGKLLAAIDVIKTHDIYHDDIVRHISKKSKKSKKGGARNHSGMGLRTKPSKSLSKRLENQKVLRKKVFQNFGKKIKLAHKKIIKHVEKIAPKIASGEIKATDALDKFIKQFTSLQNVMDRSNIHLALTGYRKDIISKDVKHTYLSTLEDISESLVPLLSGSGGVHFRGIKNAIDDLIKTVNEFTDEVTSALTKVPVVDPLKEKAKETIRNAYGGDPSAEKVFVNFEKIIRDLKYYYNIASIDRGMKIMSSEMEKYSEDYENLLGSELALMIDKVKMEAAKDIEEANIDDEKMTGDSTKLAYQLSRMPDKQKARDYMRAFRYVKEYQRDAKVGLLEVAQAVDLYMQAFANGMAKYSKDAVKNFAKLLEKMTIVAKWFNERSGDNLAQVFEYFPYNVNNNQESAPESKSSLNKDLVTKGQDHYYDWVSKIVKDGKLPGNPFLATLLTEDDMKNLVTYVDKSVKGVRALENIISTFSRLIDRFGGETPLSGSTFMRDGQIFSALMKYVVASALTHQFEAQTLNINYRDTDFQGDLNKVGIDRASTAGTPEVNIRKKIAVALSSINTELPKEDMDTKFRDDFQETDELFVMIVKAMVCKVFTVVGTYSLFNRPSTHYNSLSPLRQILGGRSGGQSERPKIYPEFVELYRRLLLLLEWYRELFQFRKSQNGSGSDLQISLVPVFDNIWSEPIKLVFEKTDYIKDGTYTDSQVRELVRCFNKIGLKYKATNPKDVVKTVIHACVIEMNRRYGFLKRKEIEAYFKAKRDPYEEAKEDYGSYSEDSVEDYDILNAKDEYGRGIAPSDKYLRFGAKYELKPAARKIKAYRQLLFKEVIKFRKQLDLDYAKYMSERVKESKQGRNVPIYSFNDTIRQDKVEISQASSEEERYNIVSRIVQGSSRFVSFGNEKVLMFHEAVKAPLAILNAFDKLLSDFNLKIQTMDLGFLEKAIENSSNNWNGITGKLKELLEKKKFDKVDYNVENAINSLVGSYIESNDPGGNLENKKRKGIKRQKLCKEFLELIYGLCVDLQGLADVRFTKEGKIVVNFSQLEQMCYKMLSHLKSTVKKFRLFIPKKYIEKVESARVGGQVNKGSIVYLEDKLVDKLFRNRYRNGLPEAMEAMNRTMNSLRQKWSDGSQESYERVIAELVYYDGGNLPPREQKNDGKTFPFNFVPMFKKGIADVAALEERAQFERYKLALQNQRKRTNIETERDRVQNQLNSMNEVVNTTKAFLSALRNNLNPTATFASRTQISTIVRNEQAYKNWSNFPKNKIEAAGLTDLINKIVNTFDQPLTKTVSANEVQQMISEEENSLDEKLRNVRNKISEFDNKISNLAAEEATVPPALADVFGGEKMIAKNRRLWYQKGKEWFNRNFGEQGLLFKMNELLGKYLHQFSDRFNNKILLDLVNTFANGVASNAVFQGKALQDIELGESNVGDPAPGVVIYASLALVIREILQRKEKGTDQHKYGITNIAELGQLMKDNLKANLPVFIKLAQMISAKAEFLKQLVLNGRLNLERNGVNYPASDGKDTVAVGFLKTNNRTSEESVNFYRKLIDDINNTTQSLKKSMELVHKQLSDTPLYFETYNGSIQDYRSRHGTNPLMPLSSLHFLLNRSDNKYDENHWMNPLHESGSDAFKFLYGTRLILARPDYNPSIDHVPGVKDILNMYNNTAEKTSKLDSGKYSDFVKLNILGLRYLIDGIYYKTWLANSLKDNLYTGVMVNRQKAYSQKLGDKSHIVISVTESGDMDSNINTIVSQAFEDGKFATTTIADKDRQALRFFNILDLNIVPINVHALRREVPLINLLNYAYTYDRMVQEKLVPEHNILEAKDVIIDNKSEATSSKQLLAKILIYPHGPRTKKEYYGYGARIATGDTSVIMGRPKYISDQLWNKALLNQLYILPKDQYNYPDESGPRVSTSQARSLNDENNSPYDINQMQYIKSSTELNIKDSNQRQKLLELGRMRYDTKLVRNLEWFVHLQRFMRQILREKMKLLDSPVSEGHDALSRQITEFKSNQVYNRQEFHTPDENLL